MCDHRQLIIEARDRLNDVLAQMDAEADAATDTDTPTHADTAIDLSAFRWNGKVVQAAPVGLPDGGRMGVGGEATKTVQWEWRGVLILHAVVAAGKPCAGLAARWYHFTQTGKPSPLLSAYGWRESKSTAPWSRWVRA